MKRCGLRHAFPFASGGGAWVPTEKNATLDHVFVSDGWPVAAYEACRICAQGLSVSDHHHGLKVTLARSDH
jgi:endonuclease/exonuclease/phosphatase family metal-dependent hydrolase